MEGAEPIGHFGKVIFVVNIIIGQIKLLLDVHSIKSKVKVKANLS